MSKINHYELTSIVDPNISDDKHPEIIEEMKKIITTNEGEITSEENLGRKKLHYPIEKALKGVFICIEFNLEGSKLKEIEKDLKLNKNILRYLVVKKPKNVKKIEIQKPTTAKKEKSTKKSNIKEEIKIESKLEKSENKVEEKSEDKKDDNKNNNELDEKLDKILNDEIID